MNPHRLIGHLVRNGDRLITKKYLPKLIEVQNGKMDFLNDTDFISIINIEAYRPRIFWWDARDANYYKLQEYIKDEPA